MRPRAQTKFILLFFILALLLLTVVGIKGLNISTDASIKEALKEIEAGLTLQASKVETFLKSASRDILFLSSIPSTRELIEAMGQGRSLDNPVINALEDEFLAFSTARGIFYQVGLTDRRGSELLRVDNDGKTSAIMPKGRLKDLSQKPYFQEASSLPEGSLYVGSIDLNRVGQKVEVPHRPVIRYAAPLYYQGSLQGVLVATLSARSFLEEFKKSPFGQGGEVLLVNKEGFYIFHPDESKGWGFALGTNQTFEKDYPQLAERVLSSEESQILETTEKVCLSLPILPNPRDASNNWKLIYIAPKTSILPSVFAMAKRYTYSLFLMAFLIFLLIGAASYGIKVNKKESILEEKAKYIEQLKQSEERYRTLLENAIEAIFILEPATGHFQEINLMGEKLTGYCRDELARMSLADMVPLPHRAQVTSFLQEAERDGSSFVHEVPLLRKDASIAFADMSAKRVNYLSSEVIQVIARDITAKKSLEEQLFHAEKLASMGKLAAGVAHEINNPLEGMNNYLDLLLSETPEADPRRGYALLLGQGLERIASVVKRVLSFAEPSRPERQRVEVNEALEKTISFVKSLPSFRAVKIQTTFNEALPPLLADRGQLEQLFLNILLNASEAMPGGGLLQVTTSLHHGPGEGGRGKNLLITFGDTGPGIPSEALDKVFDPFFSTKGSTGLGLSVVYGIVQAHQGSIRVKSQPGQGTTFEVQFPLSPDGSGEG